MGNDFARGQVVKNSKRILIDLLGTWAGRIGNPIPVEDMLEYCSNNTPFYQGQRHHAGKLSSARQTDVIGQF